MKIATKTLASLMLIAMLSLSVVNVAAAAPEHQTNKRNEKKLERIYRRHDRKMELQASVLGVQPDQLKADMKARSFDTILKQHGFKDRQSFYTALTGKLKNELKKRGWSDDKINNLIQKRLSRLSRSH